MSWYTDWFLADESEAEAVASIGSDEDDSSDFGDWPHLAMKSVGETELMLLRAILAGRSGIEDFHGDALHHDGDEDGEGGTVVCRVLPEFVAELSALTDARAEQFAVAWCRTENMTDWEPGDAAGLLREMAAFARRAIRDGRPVLQLLTW